MPESRPPRRVADLGADDPVLIRRARIARTVGICKRVGYAALLGAMAAFVIAWVTRFAGVWVDLTVAGLVIACVVLPAPIVLGWGVRAAEREDRGEKPFH